MAGFAFIIPHPGKNSNPRAIIVTGSYADGTYSETSDFSDRVYPGAKKTLRLMERVDPESAAICRRALRTFDIGDMRAWVSRLRGVYEAGGGREYRVL